MSVVNIEDTFVEMTELVLPSHSNNHGTTFGDKYLWCDIAGAVSAQRFCRSPVVTVSMDQYIFRTRSERNGRNFTGKGQPSFGTHRWK